MGRSAHSINWKRRNGAYGPSRSQSLRRRFHRPERRTEPAPIAASPVSVAPRAAPPSRSSRASSSKGASRKSAERRSICAGSPALRISSRADSIGGRAFSPFHLPRPQDASSHANPSSTIFWFRSNHGEASLSAASCSSICGAEVMASWPHREGDARFCGCERRRPRPQPYTDWAKSRSDRPMPRSATSIAVSRGRRPRIARRPANRDRDIAHDDFDSARRRMPQPLASHSEDRRGIPRQRRDAAAPAGRVEAAANWTRNAAIPRWRRRGPARPRRLPRDAAR